MELQDQKKALEGLRQALLSTEAEHAARREYRWENYINCVDDYCVGGIQDKIESEERNGLQGMIRIMEEQIENGGFTDREMLVLVLCDLETGEHLTERIIQGKYGPCFMIPGETPTFVGLAKQQKTFERKGYICATRVMTLRRVFDGTRNSKFYNRTVEVIDSKMRIEDRPGSDGYGNGCLDLWLLDNQKSHTS